jgi:hypothetical protein
MNSLLDSFDSSNVKVIVSPLWVFTPSGVDESQVEGQQYTIHRLFLVRDSPVLREMFSRAVDTSGEPVYTLAGVTKDEFEHLLWLYYNP